MTPTVLITGFEPFDGGDRNPSGELALELAERHGFAADVRAEVLPVVFRKASAAVRDLIAETRPDIVMGLGLAGGASTLRVERIGVNFFRGGPDNDGDRYEDEEVIPGGPAAYFSTFPIARLLAAIEGCGVPARDSLSAGSYCCNEVLYAALHACAGRSPEHSEVASVGFVHLPPFPEMVGEGSGSGMMCELQFRGLQAMLGVLIGAAETAT
ncbi:pyroglutamyl-peptidase I [Candidatus Poribacteria bacterium]|nr:pyroglutamyl-peptidase I [Candidatus Poribacteria bacterium]